MVRNDALRLDGQDVDELPINGVQHDYFHAYQPN